MLITASEVKIICPSINTNIDDTLIENGIDLVTDTLIKDSIGQEWLEQLQIQMLSGTTGLTIANKYMVDNFIKYILSYGVWQYLVVSLSLMLMPDGLRIKTSDHSAAAESVDLSFYRNYIQSFIDNKREGMYRYISYHSSSYPLYYTDKYGDEPIEHRYNFKISKVQKDYYDDRPLGNDTGPVL
jgi:hypothetical protein